MYLNKSVQTRYSLCPQTRYTIWRGAASIIKDLFEAEIK